MDCNWLAADAIAGELTAGLNVDACVLTILFITGLLILPNSLANSSHGIPWVILCTGDTGDVSELADINGLDTVGIAAALKSGFGLANELNDPDLGIDNFIVCFI